MSDLTMNCCKNWKCSIPLPITCFSVNLIFSLYLGFTNKSAIALSHLKGVHFGKSSGRSTPRRSSSRSIKRKKFDDELVESSLKNPGKPLGMPEVPEPKEKLKKV